MLKRINSIISYTLAAMAGVCFFGGVAVLHGERR